MHKLYLDDSRLPYDVYRDTIDSDYEINASWQIVKSCNEFIDYIENKSMPDLISFDHNLSIDQIDHYRPENQKGNIDYDKFKEKAGYHAAYWLSTALIKRLHFLIIRFTV